MVIVSSEFRSVGPNANPYLNALIWGDAYTPGITINYVLQGAPGDGAFGGATWSTTGARSAFAAALATWSAVTNIRFVEMAGPYDGTGSTSAYDWIERFDDVGYGILGFHDLPATGTLEGAFSNEPGIFTAATMQRGGSGFEVFVHEIGHGLGLVHPHNDEEDPPGDPAFPGVTGPYSVGFYRLNQAVYTVMTYNDTYEEVGFSLDDTRGWTATPMAFDIAAVQALYGANMETNAGDTAYGIGSSYYSDSWSCIWDAGGIDTISADGDPARAFIIDLRAATLLSEPGGGGFVSRAVGKFGGVTIANGVVIENASGGIMGDRIHGNSADNLLDGGLGYDFVDFSGSTANLSIDLAAGVASGEGDDILVSFEAATGGAGNDTIRAIAGTLVAAGSLDIYKRSDELHNSLQSALDLDYRFADRTGDSSIPMNSGMVSVKIHAAGSGSSDYYSFTLSNSGPVLIDIDSSFGFDSIINVYDSRGSLLITNDDAETPDYGSASPQDSFVTLQNAESGQRIFIEVKSFGGDIPAGASYDLAVSLVTDRVAAGQVRVGSIIEGLAGNDAIYGGSGEDRLYGGAGDDTLTGAGSDDIIDGGPGTDTAVFAGQRSGYVVTVTGERTEVFGTNEGTETLISIEKLKFADGTYVWNAVAGTLERQNSAPVAPARLDLTTAEDQSLAIATGATDPDGDTIVYTITTQPLHGTLVAGANGSFTYEPAANFHGSDSFELRIGDGSAQAVLQAVFIAVTSVNDIPVLAQGSQSLTGKAGVPIAVTVAASDVDGDVLAYSASTPAHGQITGGAAGAFTYTSPVGFSGTDSFDVMVSDGHGGSVLQQVNVTVTVPQFRMFASDGFAGTIGGVGNVFGTNGFQDISVAHQQASVRFDASFNKGGDIIRLEGDAGDYAIRLSGSSAVISDGVLTCTIPIGTVGIDLVFDDGARTLVFDAGQQVAKIGVQDIIAQAITISAPAQAADASGAVTDSATAKIFLDEGASVDVGGDIALFGTSGHEHVQYLYGDLTLDPSFNRGGDTIAIPGQAADFSARLAGSTAMLQSELGDVAIPVGTVGMTLAFGSDERELVYDNVDAVVLIGDQVVTATTAQLQLFG